MAASKILVHGDPGRIDKAGHLIYLDGQNRGRGSGEIDLGQYDQMEDVLWPDGCAAMYRREMLDRIGWLRHARFRARPNFIANRAGLTDNWKRLSAV